MPYLTGKIFNIANYTIHDGPGIRTTVFFKGCPARCLWCCNPESQEFGRELLWNRQVCSRCGRCVSVCRHGAISGGIAIDGINRDLCTGCGECSRSCPKGALEMSGTDFTAEELFAKVRKDEPFWRRSGGGVTLSGGEVLSQPLFAEEFLNICKSRYVSTVIQTCLFASLDTVKKITGLADHVQFDLKAIDNLLHRRLTSLGNENILDNAAWLLSGEKPLTIRLPLIPGYNDGEDNLRALGEFIASYRAGATLEILRYHSMGAGKYEALGRDYTLYDLIPPASGELARAAEILRLYPVNVIYS